MPLPADLPLVVVVCVFRATTTPLSVTAAQSTVETALNALPNIGPNGVTVSRLPVQVGVNGLLGYFWSVTFSGPLAGGNVSPLQIDTSNVVANSLLANVTVLTNGSEVCTYFQGVVVVRAWLPCNTLTVVGDRWVMVQSF